MTDQLADQLRQLPTDPGIYKYFDTTNDLIYVGKAVNLKNRVKSYFSGQQSPKTQVLVKNIAKNKSRVIEKRFRAHEERGFYDRACVVQTILHQLPQSQIEV